MDYIVERGIPIPGTTPKNEGKAGRGRKAIYPFGTMAIGDSFFVSSSAATSVKVSKAAFMHGETYGKKFKTKSMLDGARCWRIANRRK